MVQDSDVLTDVADISAQAHQKLERARQLLSDGNCIEARNMCRKLLAEHTEYVGAMVLLGQAYVELQNYDRAFPCFNRAAMLSPCEPSIYLHLARTYYHLGAGEIALHKAELALSLQPESVLAGEAHLLLGRVYEQRADYETAGEHLVKALSLNPDLNDAALLQIRCLIELQEWDKAEAAYASISEGDVPLTERCWIVCRLAEQTDAASAKEMLAQIKALSAHSDKLEDDKQRAIFVARLEFARASLLQAQENYDAAWDALKAANSPLHKLHEADFARSQRQHSHTLKRAKEWNFTGTAETPLKAELPLSLFLLGASQDAIATLERLIGSMPGVKSGRESDVVQAAARRTCQVSGLMTLRFPGQLPKQLHETFSEIYGHELSLRAPGSKLYTITHPDMVMDLGPIAGSVPNMRILFLDRDMDDAALRIFSAVQDGNTGCSAFDIAGIYEYLEGYEQLASVWSERLKALVMRVKYEDMLANPLKNLKQISEFCNLPAPNDNVVELRDGRGCAKPYLDHLKAARNLAQT